MMIARTQHFLRNLTIVCLMIGVAFVLSACDLTTQSDLLATREQMRSPEGCIACQMFKVIFTAIVNMTNTAYPRMCVLAQSLLAVFLFGWILLHVLKFLTTMREPNIGQFWAQLSPRLGKGMLVAILVASKENIFYIINMIMEPISSLFMNVSSLVISSGWNSRISLSMASLHSGLPAAPGFPTEIGNQVETLIYRVVLALDVGWVMGLRLMLNSDFANMILGMVTTYIFFMMSLFFPFLLIDGFFKLMVVFVTLPLLLVAWVFKFTESYLKKGFQIFLGAFAQILMSCIFITLAITVMEGFFEIRGMSGWLSADVQNMDKDMYEQASRMSFSFLTFILIATYLYNLSKSITKVTAYFTGAPAQSVLGAAMERLKAVFSAIMWSCLALTASFVPGGWSMAQTAASNAKDKARQAAAGGGR